MATYVNDLPRETLLALPDDIKIRAGQLIVELEAIGYFEELGRQINTRCVQSIIGVESSSDRELANGALRLQTAQQLQQGFTILVSELTTL